MEVLGNGILVVVICNCKEVVGVSYHSNMVAEGKTSCGVEGNGILVVVICNSKEVVEETRKCKTEEVEMHKCKASHRLQHW
jgi:hypothetical protein